MIKYMSKSVTECVTEMSQKYKHSTKMELPTVWGNVKCTDGIRGVRWCNGRCDGRRCDGVCDGVWVFGKDSFEECPLTPMF